MPRVAPNFKPLADLAYDGLGRPTALPAVDAGGTGSGDVTLRYFANDMVASQTQGSTSRTWTLDPAARLHSWQDTSGINTAVHTNHYIDGGDAPGWIDEGDGTWTRNLLDPTGALALIGTGTAEAATSASVQLHNLHGDIVATLDAANPAAGIGSYAESTEFGAPRNPSEAPSRYGWLGDKRRSSDDLAGLILMGVRQYNPVTGLFSSADPTPQGGATPYLYPSDPVNFADLSGRCWGVLEFFCPHSDQPIYMTVKKSSYEMGLEGEEKARLDLEHRWLRRGGRIQEKLRIWTPYGYRVADFAGSSYLRWV
ncbi:MAG: RHS repeat-associated core domain-containing protein [Motilibacteraceae bacterium]